jgi:rhodanese-related sulfurtransferase
MFMSKRVKNDHVHKLIVDEFAPCLPIPRFEQQRETSLQSTNVNLGIVVAFANALTIVHPTLTYCQAGHNSSFTILNL